MMLSMSDNSAVLAPAVGKRLSAKVPDTVQSVVRAVLEAAPAYSELFGTPMGGVIEDQIGIALRTYLKMAAHGLDAADPQTAQSLVRPATEAAYELGRNEARLGGGTETLLTAFRVGARTTWHAFAATLTSSRVSAADVANFAEQLFDFIDQLSAAAVAGHEFQSTRDMRVRDAERDLLCRDLLHGRDPGSERIARAEWVMPTSVTIVIARDAEMRRWSHKLPAGSLIIAGDLPEPLDGVTGLAAAAVPDLSAGTRERLITRMRDAAGVMGPVVPVGNTPESFRWAALLWQRDESTSKADRPLGVVDATSRAVDVMMAAEGDVIRELRRRHLANLDGMAEATRDRLEETLRVWLDHRGRHDLVAEHLHVHPQTVRYRIKQLQIIARSVSR